MSRISALFALSTAFTFLVFTSFLITSLQAQPRIFENGQKTIFGQDAGMDPDSPTRSKIDLAGNWNYTVDNENWSPVKVPSAFDYEGTITFQRKFSVTDAQIANSSFRFVAFGINYESEVYINDVFVGKHVGGYTSFSFDVPDNALQIGPENTIRIIVRNKLNSRSTVPLRQQIWGWRNYGGILRDIYLLQTPKIRISSVQLKTTADSSMGTGYVTATATISNTQDNLAHYDSLLAQGTEQSFTLLIQVVERSTNTVVARSDAQSITVEPNHDKEVAVSLSVTQPQLWSPDNPALYVLQTVIAAGGEDGKIIDEEAINFGFRNVHSSGNLLRVNGADVQLKGVVWHEDYPGKGSSMTYEEMERDVATMKSLGVNAIRFGFHPPHPYMINLCNRYGLFALEELPVWNVPGDILAGESFQVIVSGMIHEMVLRDQASPSVLAWGVGSNFDSATEEAVHFVDRAVLEFRALDDRPIYCGTQMLSNDKCASHVDIAAVDLTAMNLNSFKSQLTVWKTTHQSQPVFLLAYGKEVDHANTQGWYDPLSQQAQARFFLLYYAAVRESGIAGSFISSYADWTGDRPILTVDLGNPFVYPVGLVSQRREKRLAFDMVRAQYGDEKTAALPPGSQKTGFPIAHVISGFFVILVLGYQYAYNRRFSEAIKRALMRSYNFYSDLRDFRAISLMQTLLLSILISVTMAVIFSSIFYHYRTDRFFDFVLTYFIVSDFLKEVAIRATWNPLQGIVFFSAVFFTFLFVVAFLIKICSMMVRSKIRWYHAYGVAVWSAMPIVFLSPAAMSLFKVMENPLYVIPSLALILVFFLWTISRIISGIAVIYDISGAKTYIGGIVVLALILGSAFLYYESVYAISASVKFAYDLARSLG